MAPALLEASIDHATSALQCQWEAPSDGALVAHNSTHDGASESCRSSSVVSTSADSSASSDDERLASSVSEDSDSGADQHGPVPDILLAVELHLEDMNVASEVVNQAQRALKECAQQQQALERDRAHRELLAKSIGMDSLAKAAPYYDQLQRCRAARKAGQQASIQYCAALEDTDSDIIHLEAKHAACLAEYHAAQRMLTKVEENIGLPRKILDVALLYLDAEKAYRLQIKEVVSTMKELKRHVEVAKSGYRVALRSLEAISDREHRQRTATL